MARNMHAFSAFLFWKHYLVVQLNGQLIRYYTVLHSLFRANAFLIKFFKNFQEQVEDFFQRHKWQFSNKKSATQLIFNKVIKLSTSTS